MRREREGRLIICICIQQVEFVRQSYLYLFCILVFDTLRGFINLLPFFYISLHTRRRQNG
jgi:hypothetical protein